MVFSFRNEEETLPVLVARVVTVLEPLTEYELVFVNDASTDRSLEILKDLREKNPRIKVMTMSRCFGVSAGVFAGIAAATGDAVVYMDADLQDPPDVIPEMLRKWQAGADVVHTIRLQRQGESLAKTALTKVAYKVINALSDVDLHENAGDFKLLSRRAVEALKALREHDPYLRGLSAWIGFRQDTVFYVRQPRFGGRTKFSLLSSLNPYQEFVRGITFTSGKVTKVTTYFVPIIGLGVFASSWGMIAYILVNKLRGVNLPGWTAIMTAILFIGGLLTFAVGVVWVYVVRIYDEIRGRPKYIIADRIGFE